MKIADIEMIELQNIPVTPPLFKQPLRTGVRLLKLKTDDGLIGLSQFGGFMHSATAAFIQHDLAPLLKGQRSLGERAFDASDAGKFNTRAHAGVWNFAVSAIDAALWDIKGKFYNTPVWRLLGGAQKSIPAYITFGLRATAAKSSPGPRSIGPPRARRGSKFRSAVRIFAAPWILRGERRASRG